MADKLAKDSEVQKATVTHVRKLYILTRKNRLHGRSEPL